MLPRLGNLFPAGNGCFPPTRQSAESYCVDAACSGSPGPLGIPRCRPALPARQIFRQGPYEHGTNNVGEFLAIVHALVLLEKKKSAMPIYSDSATAIGWVKKKRCNTELAA